MNTDIRLDTQFFTHPKTLRLVADLGPEGVLALLRLWTWAGLHATGGVLPEARLVNMAAGWLKGDTLVPALVGAGFVDECLEGEPGHETVACYRLHDWEDHQPWAVGAPARQARARAAARQRWASDGDAGGTAPGNADSNAPSPSPKPSPKKETVSRRKVSDTADQLIEEYCNFTGKRSVDRTARMLTLQLQRDADLQVRMRQALKAYSLYLRRKVQVGTYDAQYVYEAHNWFGQKQRWRVFDVDENAGNSNSDDDEQSSGIQRQGEIYRQLRESGVPDIEARAESYRQQQEEERRA